jgi:hypothetical protein
MNNGSLWRGILIALLVLGAAAAIGVGAYNAGVTQGIAESSRALAASPPTAGVPYPYYGWHRPWGFGFFPIFPLFFIFFVFLALRGLFWRGPRYYGGWGCGYGYGPPPDRRADEAHPRS